MRLWFLLGLSLLAMSCSNGGACSKGTYVMISKAQGTAVEEAAAEEADFETEDTTEPLSE